MLKEEFTPKVLESEKFMVFSQEYDNNLYSGIEIKFLYLKGHCNLPVHSIARYLAIRYAEALQMGKKLEGEVSNLRADKKLAILIREKVSSEHLLTLKARQARKIMEEIERRSNDADQYKHLSDKQLMELLEKLESGLTIEHDYSTGNFDLGSFPLEKFKGHF